MERSLLGGSFNRDLQTSHSFEKDNKKRLTGINLPGVLFLECGVRN
ncbi:hypothetical protein LOC67_05090 [Stieleria sp. JC731]|nr:hypothetical protein [Stieleria sp. JC731]MCC9599927.1 hypothetical protein [Stieleria sp. JC731]